MTYSVMAGVTTGLIAVNAGPPAQDPLGRILICAAIILSAFTIGSIGDLTMEYLDARALDREFQKLTRAGGSW